MKKNKNILFISTLYAPHIGGGAEIILQEQVEGLLIRGFDVAVLATGPDKGLNSEYINGIKVYRAGLKNLYWHFTKKKHNNLQRLVWHIKDSYNSSMQKYVQEVIENEKPDVVICHNITGWSISVWDEIKRAEIPVVQVLHDLYLLCPGSNMFKRGKACKSQCSNCKILRKRHLANSDKVDAVVGVSNYILKRFEKFEYFKKAQKHVIHNAREIPEVESKSINTAYLPLRFGYIGTLSEVKGVEWLINQFQKLKINATLTIAGKGLNEYEEHLRSLVRSEKIRFIGYCQSEDFYKQIDVNIIPSLWPDTFPGVAYESGAYHLPVIATKIGGLPEIIKEGVNGILIDVDGPDSLSEAILRLYNNPNLYTKLSENSRNSVSELLSVDRMLDEYEEVINMV